MTMPTDNFTFNGFQYRFIVPQNQRTPRPKPAITGEWRHIPYSNENVFVTVTGKMHTVWAPPGGIYIPDYSNYMGFYNSAGADFFSLTVPWGTESARLTPESVVNLIPHEDGSFRGACVWEWA